MWKMKNETMILIKEKKRGERETYRGEERVENLEL